MKPYVMKFLVCPACRSELELQAQVVEGEEVLEGHAIGIERTFNLFPTINTFALVVGYSFNL